MGCERCRNYTPGPGDPPCSWCGSPPPEPPRERLPPGIQGWCWGGFLLGGFWAIGNRTWIGVLAFVPYVGLLVSIWLGFKGREMAWKNAKWDGVEHFNRVQSAWSAWGVLFQVLLGAAVIGSRLFADSADIVF